MEEAKELVSALEVILSKGNTAPSDVYKSVNTFVRANDGKITKNISAILEHFHPSNHIGRTVRIRLVDKCRASAEVVNVLQNGRPLEKKRVLRCTWFFESLENPQNFVTNATLALPYNVRVKVINKYAKNLKSSKSAENLYMAMKSKYGVKSALNLLPACEEGFVKSELASLTDTVLDPSVTLALLQKHPSLAKEYMWRILEATPRKLSKRKPFEFEFSGYEPVFYSVSQIDLPMFLNMYEIHGRKIPYINLGGKTLKKLSKFHLDRVLNNTESFEKFLELRKLLKSLCLSDVKRVYAAWVLPATLKEFFELDMWRDAHRILSHYKPSVRQDILWSGFRLKYKTDPFGDDCLFKMKKLWVNLMPLATQKKYIEYKTAQIDQPKKLAKYLAYLPFDQSIPKLKCLMNSHSEQETRSAICEQMVCCLRHNECPKELKDVLTYLRNLDDSKKMKECLISELGLSKELLLQLEMDDWAPIDNLLNSVRSKEYKGIEWSVLHIMEIHIHCCFLRGFNAEPLLGKHLDYLGSHRDLQDHEVITFHDTPFHIKWLEWLLKALPGFEWRKKQNRLSVVQRLLRQIDVSNQTHRRNPIVLPKNFVELLESIVNDGKQNDDDYGLMFKHLKRYPAIRNHLLELSCPDIAARKESTLCNLLKLNPVLLSEKLSTVAEILLTKSFSEYVRFYSQCRLYESYGIPQKLIQCCRISLMIEDQGCFSDTSPLRQSSTQPEALQVLSVLLEPPELLDVVTKYFAAQLTIKPTQKFHDMTRFLEALFMSLERTSHPRQTLPILEQFAASTSKHIKASVRSSLNNICFQLPEGEVLPVLRSWAGPIETQKIVMRHIYRISPLQALIDLPKNAKNCSFQCFSFQQMRRIFYSNPNPASFNVLSSMVKHLKREDIVMKELLYLKDANDTYLSPYLQLIWNRINSNWTTDIIHDRRQFLETLNKNVIDVLDQDFCDVLVEYELSNLPNSTTQFVHLCLLSTTELVVFSSRMNRVIAALTQITRSNSVKYHLSEGNVIEVCQAVTEFVFRLCRESITYDSRNASETLKRVKEALSGLVESTDFLKESYWMDAHILYHDLKTRGQLKEYKSALRRLQEEYIEANEGICTIGITFLSDVELKIASYDDGCLFYKINKVSEHPLSQMVAAGICESEDSDDEFNCGSESCDSDHGAGRIMEEMLKNCVD